MKYEIRQNVTYPVYYCNNCGKMFPYFGNEKYPSCLGCRSRTKNFTYERNQTAFNLLKKLFACCKKCLHIWMLSATKLNTKTHCPKCHFHSTGKRFYWFFIHEIQNKKPINELRPLLRSRFPHKEDMYFSKFDDEGNEKVVEL